jgi:hypothetical protein
MYLDKVAAVASWTEGLQAVDSSMGDGRMHVNHPQKKRFDYFGSRYEAYLIIAYLKALCMLRKDINFNQDLIYQRLVKIDSGNILDLSKIDNNEMLYVYYDRFSYKKEKIGFIPITSGQIAYEQWWLYESMRGRSFNKAIQLMATSTDKLKLHPLFYKIDGTVEDCEVIK